MSQLIITKCTVIFQLNLHDSRNVHEVGTVLCTGRKRACIFSACLSCKFMMEESMSLPFCFVIMCSQTVGSVAITVGGTNTTCRPL